MKKTNNPMAVVLQLVLVLVIFPLLPMLIAWRWNWWEAWLVAIAFLLVFILSRALAARKHPGILAERSNSFANQQAKPWDRFLAPLMAFGTIFTLLIAGLEERFAWTPTPFPLWAKIGGIVILLLSYALGSWALIENAFFSGIVRIQTERGHTVCNSGPYRLVRHPGYLGNLLAFWTTPIILDSALGLIAAAFLLVVTLVRTSLEDRTLQAELPGYVQYAQQVKYRLLPGIW